MICQSNTLGKIVVLNSLRKSIDFKFCMKKRLTYNKKGRRCNHKKNRMLWIRDLTAVNLNKLHESASFEKRGKRLKYSRARKVTVIAVQDFRATVVKIVGTSQGHG